MGVMYLEKYHPTSYIHFTLMMLERFVCFTLVAISCKRSLGLRAAMMNVLFVKRDCGVRQQMAIVVLCSRMTLNYTELHVNIQVNTF